MSQAKMGGDGGSAGISRAGFGDTHPHLEMLKPTKPGTITMKPGSPGGAVICGGHSGRAHAKAG